MSSDEIGNEVEEEAESVKLYEEDEIKSKQSISKDKITLPGSQNTISSAF